MTKRPTRRNGVYQIHGKTYKIYEGSREQVFNGTAYHTPGGLTKSQLIKNRWGRIVSAKKHATAKKEKRLEKAGYFAQKGKFGYVKRDVRKTRKSRGSRKMKGGDSTAAPAAAAPLVKEEEMEPVQLGGEEPEEKSE